MSETSTESLLPPPPETIILPIKDSKKTIELTLNSIGLREDCLAGIQEIENTSPGTYNLEEARKVVSKLVLTANLGTFVGSRYERMTKFDGAQGLAFTPLRDDYNNFDTTEKGAIGIFLNVNGLLKDAHINAGKNEEMIARILGIMSQLIYWHEVGHIVQLLQKNPPKVELTTLEMLAPTIIKTSGFSLFFIGCAISAFAPPEMPIGLRTIISFAPVYSGLFIAEVFGNEEPGSGSRYQTPGMNPLEDFANEYAQKHANRDSKAISVSFF